MIVQNVDIDEFSLQFGDIVVDMPSSSNLLHCELLFKDFLSWLI